MLRRFEMYRFAGNAGDTARDALCSAFLEASRYIPDLLHSAIGRDVAVHRAAGADVARAGEDPTRTAIDVVWEHAFRSADSYRRYMEHPYHASVLDRYLLADSPERVVGDAHLGVGLAGYRCEAADFFLASGIRRLLFLDLRGHEPPDVAAAHSASSRVRRDASPDVSVFAANTMASAWFDGETPVGPRPIWTHLLEEGYADAGGATRRMELKEGAGAPGSGFRLPDALPALVISYRIQPGWGYGAR